MKTVLALVTLALTTLVFEEKARQVAGDVHETYNDLAGQACSAKKALTATVDPYCVHAFEARAHPRSECAEDHTRSAPADTDDAATAP